MARLGLEITLVLLLIAANGFFALAEIAVVASRKTRLKERALEGSRRAQIALELANSPSDFLATIQIGITLTSTLAGAFGGATIAGEIAGLLRRIPALVPYADTIGICAVVLSVSYISLVLGELVPKNLSLRNPERVATGIAPIMRRLASIVAPAVRLLSWSTGIALRVLPIKGLRKSPVSEGEIRMMIEEAAREGSIDKTEKEMIEGVFRLANRRAGELMTARANVTWLSTRDTPAEIERKIAHSRYSRFPVVEDDRDRVLGVVYVKDLLSRALLGQPLDVEVSLRKAVIVPRAKRALEILELFQATGVHIAIVTGEEGRIEGILTFSDIVDAVVADLPSSNAAFLTRMKTRHDGAGN